MKDAFKFLLVGTIVIALFSCKKTNPETAATYGKFSIPNKVSNVPSWEVNTRVELFKDPLDTNRWRTYAQYDGQTFYFKEIQLRNGYAVGKLTSVITGTPENPSGEYPNIVVNDGNVPEASLSRLFAYSRAVCVNTTSKSSRSWATYNFSGKDSAGNTIVILRDSLQNSMSFVTDQLLGDDIEFGELDASKTTLTYTRVNFSINCSQPNKVVPIKLIAIKDENQIVHYYVSNPYFNEKRVFIIDETIIE